MPGDIAANQRDIVFVDRVPELVRNRRNLPIGESVRISTQPYHLAWPYARQTGFCRHGQHVRQNPLYRLVDSSCSLVHVELCLGQYRSHGSVAQERAHRALGRIVEQRTAQRRTGESGVVLYEDRARAIGARRVGTRRRHHRHLDRRPPRYRVGKSEVHPPILMALQFSPQAEHRQELRQPVAQALARGDGVGYLVKGTAVLGNHLYRRQTR